MEKEEKKQLLEEKNIHLWFAGSPVSLQSMKLELDMNVGAIFAYAKFMNVQPENIKSMVCDIICYDSLRTQIDILRDCVYDGFEIKRNEEFGTKVPFKIKNQQTRNIEFVIKSVTTVSGQTWVNREGKRFNMSLVQESIFNVQASLHEQFIRNCQKKDIDHTKLILQPKFDDDYWLCACGTLNWNDEHFCCSCGVSKEWLAENVDKQFLEIKNKERQDEVERYRAQAAEQERIDKERQKEEFKKRKEAYEQQLKKSSSKKRAGKIVPIILIAVLLAGGGTAGVIYGLPYYNYRTAMAEYEKGNYDAAKAKFEKITDYRDSSEMVYQCVYSKAESYSAAGSYQSAAEMFMSIDGFSDAAEKYVANMVLYADELYQESKYIDSMKIFREIERTEEESYKNCQEKVYGQARRDLKKQIYKRAYEKYSFLGDYKDSAENANQCLYVLAKLDYEGLDYKSALEKYQSMKGYKDVDEKLKKYSLLEKLISAVGSDGSPSVWNAYDVDCPKCGRKAEYVLEFGDDGHYSFGVSCENDGKYAVKNGKFRIEDKVLYEDYYVEGQMKFKKMAEIKKVDENASDKEGKNISITMTDPINNKNESTIKIYGNIISDETVSLG